MTKIIRSIIISQLSPKANSKVIRNDHKDTPKNKNCRISRERAMTYLRFGWGYDMKRFLAVLVGDFYIWTWTWHFPHVYSFIPFYCFKILLSPFCTQCLSFFFFLKKSAFLNYFFHLLWLKGQTVFDFRIFHCQLLFPCKDCRVVTSNPSFLDVNFRLTCFQLLFFLLNHSKKTQSIIMY